MLRVVAKLLVASAISVGVACGSSHKPVKHAKKQPDAKTLRDDARNDVKAGNYDDADKKYAQSYEASKSFDTLEEYVYFLAENGRAAKAVEALCAAGPLSSSGYSANRLPGAHAAATACA
jgi:hypothetical protein